MILLDTDILIWILRGNKEIKEQFSKIVTDSNGLVFLAPIQIAEIYAGLREKERVETELFLDSFHFVDINKNIGKLAGQYLNKYSKSHNVTISDSMIAACIKVHSCKLWTLNHKHYPMLEEKHFI